MIFLQNSRKDSSLSCHLDN